MKSVELSKSLISESDMRKNLVRLFPESLVLKANWEIAAASRRVTSLLGYPAEELVGHELGILADDDKSLSHRVERELARGFFDDMPTSLRNKAGSSVSCRLSGFYLGLISDMNGIVILTIKSQDDAVALSKQLEASRNELDEFVYRTTHDIRGPLATMLGLINLMKLDLASATTDMRQLIGLLDNQARILDNRTLNLAYLSESGRPKIVESILDCELLEYTLRSTIEQTVGVKGIDFQFMSVEKRYVNPDSRLTMSMLNHILLYLINLPMDVEPTITYSLESLSMGLRVTVNAKGFQSNYQLRQAISQQDPLYTTVITYSDLISFFAALKNAQRLKSTIHIDYIFENSQQISVFIPTRDKL